MEGVIIIEAKTEERPYFFKFKKFEVIGDHPTMAKLTYDPFPEAKMEDVVRLEIIGRELILYAKLKTDNMLHPSIPIPYNGHDFYLTRSEQDMKTNIVEFKGSAFLTEIQPMKVLANLREKCAALNPKI